MKAYIFLGEKKGVVKLCKKMYQVRNVQSICI